MLQYMLLQKEASQLGDKIGMNHSAHFEFRLTQRRWKHDWDLFSMKKFTRIRRHAIGEW